MPVRASERERETSQVWGQGQLVQVAPVSLRWLSSRRRGSKKDEWSIILEGEGYDLALGVIKTPKGSKGAWLGGWI